MCNKCVVHFVGTHDVVTVTGDWFDNIVFSERGLDMWQFVGNRTLINMSNVSYIEVVDDGD
jgi:hypothetical protein